jgi:preprotein translocase subunit SecG
MSFLIGLLTFIMVLDCIVLILLVLIQLPKKESGAGLAFGAGASDALFGAGSGNVLTKVTKYAATVFFVLAIVLAMMQTRFSGRSGSDFQRALDRAAGPASVPATTTTTSSVPASTTAGTNALFSAPAPSPATSGPPVTPPAGQK